MVVRLLVPASVALLALAGCGGGEAAPAGSVVIDDLARPVAIGRPARRIVSLLPSANDLVLALGGGDRLVARTRFDRDPRLASLRSVGDPATPDLETLVRLDPDLVVAWAEGGNRALVEHLRNLGIRVYAAEPSSVDDVLRLTRHLGLLLGVPARADSLRHAVTVDLADVAGRVGDAEPPSVLCVVWHDPLSIAGPGTFLDRMITAAGGRNAFPDIRGGWPEVSIEEVLRRDPDAIVVTGGASTSVTSRERGAGARSADLPAWLRDRPGWSNLRAVREGRVLVVDPDLFHRPGPRIGEAARLLAGFLHPERFPRGAR